jgi:hypothetical protein
MPLLKSEKAKQELASKQRVLSVRERSALFLADGIRTRDELIWLVQGDVGLVQKLVADGYLLPAESLGSKAAQFFSAVTASASGARCNGPQSCWFYRPGHRVPQR